MKPTALGNALSVKSSTIAYFLSIAMLGTFTSLGGPALPTLAENTSSTLDQISLYFVLGSLGYLLGSLIGGRYYDRLPGNKIVALTLVGVAVSGALIPTARELGWLLFVQFTLGLAEGANDVGCNTLLLWAHGKKAGPYINGLHFSFGVGTFIAPLVLAGFLNVGWGIQGTFWIFALLSLLLAAWIWTIPEINKPGGAPDVSSKAAPFFPAAYLVFAFVFYVGAEVGLGDWVYTYALTRGLGTTITSAYLTAAFWGTFTAGRLVGVWISLRFKPISILIADLLGCLASLSLIAFWPDSATMLWIGAIGSGLFMASVFPTLLLLAEERIQISGRVTSWFLVGGGAGSMVLPWIIGQAFVQAGTGALPLTALVAIALTGTAVFLFTSRTADPLP